MQGIQIALFAFSTALIVGIIYGMSSKVDDLSLDMLARGSEQKGYAQDEKRRERRVKCNLFIEIMDHQEHVANIGRLLNLSSTGACITSNADLRRGEPVLARLPTLRNGANRISGRVVWARATSSSTLYGIQLNRVTPTN
jgi:hypothetical protein